MYKAVNGSKAITATMSLSSIYLLLLDRVCLLCLGFARKYFIAAYVKHQTFGQAERETCLSFSDSCQCEVKAFSSQVL